MKRVIATGIALSLLLSGCSSADEMLEPALQLREKLQVNTCTFVSEITADYTDEVYQFAMDCIFDPSATMQFSVTGPETIAGITGQITDSSGMLTFDDKVLAFPLMADGQLSPVSVPWVVMRSLCSGYLRSGAEWEEGTKVTIDDSFSDDTIQVDVWLNSESVPLRAEVLWQGRRILSLSVKEFQYV